MNNSFEQENSVLPRSFPLLPSLQSRTIPSDEGKIILHNSSETVEISSSTPKVILSSSSGEIESYVNAVCDEISRWRISVGQQKITSIFFGGGTPSLLHAKHIQRVLETADKSFSFSNSIEITTEANPESAVRGSWLNDVYNAGINRVSFGAQSFFEEELQMLGRVHTAQEVEEAVEKARNAGFSSINLDLMWGLPKKHFCSNTKSFPLEKNIVASQHKENQQGVEHWLSVLEHAVSLNPEHISAYALTVEDNTPLYFSLEQGELSLPEEDAEKAMFFEGIKLLENHGYVHYEVSNFCKESRECQHNLGYWQGSEYIGVGPSAVSTVSGVRYTNCNNIVQWKQHVRGEALTQDKEALSFENQRKEKLMLSLRMAQGLDLALWKKETGQSFERECHDLIEALVGQGYLKRSKERISFTPQGFYVSNEIISRFFEIETLFSTVTTS